MVIKRHAYIRRREEEKNNLIKSKYNDRKGNSFGNDGRIKLKRGIDILAEAVSSTLGASGKTVIIEDQFGNPHITKDGVTVANTLLVKL